jgi:hypothetical protein
MGPEAPILPPAALPGLNLFEFNALLLAGQAGGGTMSDTAH